MADGHLAKQRPLDAQPHNVIFEIMRFGQLLLILPASCLGYISLSALNPAQAQATPISRLVYVKGIGAEACPEPMQLRTAVIARLGYDPFSATANKTIIAAIERNGETLHGKVALLNEEGTSQGARELNSPHDRCSELVRAMALSISIAIDPEAALARSDTPSSSDSQSNTELVLSEPGPMLPDQDEPAADEPAAVTPAPQREHQPRAIGYFTGFGLHATFAQAPATGYGADILLSGRYRFFSLSFEGRYDGQRMAQKGIAEVGAMFLLASIVPCLHLGPAAFCGIASTGLIRATSEKVTRPSSADGQYTALGFRMGLEFPLVGAWSLRLHADAFAPVREQSIQIYQENRTFQKDQWVPLWTSSELAVLVGTALVVHY